MANDEQQASTEDSSVVLISTAQSKEVWAKQERVRQAIAFCYIERLKMPEETEWVGRLGTIHQIMIHLGLSPANSYQVVQRVLQNITLCQKENIAYTGERQGRQQN
jgi:hypothetical protein